MTELTVFHSDVREILRTARKKSYTAINLAMVEAYWLIGRRIVVEEQAGKERAGYGNKLITGLSRTLSDEFGNGFSVANLKNFRQFYMTFPDFTKSYTLCSQLSWSHLLDTEAVRIPLVSLTGHDKKTLKTVLLEAFDGSNSQFCISRVPK